MARIVFVGNSPLHPGGGGLLAHYMLDSLPRAGHRVRAIFPIYPHRQAWREACRQRCPQMPVAWYDMPALRSAFADIPAAELARQTQAIQNELRDFLATEPVDLIYLHKESTIWGMPAFARADGLRCVAALHGNLLAMLRGYFDVARPEDWLAAYSETDLVTCCADHMTASLRAAGLKNLVTIKNGVDVAQFRPQPWPSHLATRHGLTRDDVVVMHASNLKQIKRPLDIIAAFAAALGRDRRLVLLIAGEGEMEGGVRAEVERLGIASRVRFAGWIDNAVMADYYALADFTVLASASEGLSMTCLESMACGRPVLASDIPGSRELITHDAEGLLFPVGDVDAIADTILAAAQDPNRRRRLGAAARSKVVKGFTLAQMERRWLETIDSLLAPAS